MPEGSQVLLNPGELTAAVAPPVEASVRNIACFHCGLEVPENLRLPVRIDGEDRLMCCPGCQAVAAAIVAAGHENYYRVRSAKASSARLSVADSRRESRVYDLPEVQRRFVRVADGNLREASLMLEGITCAACVWLNEQQIAALAGVASVTVNYSNHRALVRWDESRIKLSEILEAINAIGYRALPYDAEQQQQSRSLERRQRQRRLAIAGVFGMQVMMLSISLYAGAFSGIEREFEQFFRWLMLILSLPVVAYAALPFYAGAWRSLRCRQANMDLPVSLAIVIAFLASAYATLRGQGDVYFDSVVMFVFFLTASRHIEAIARQACAATVERLVQARPLTATRLAADAGDDETVAAAALAIGDVVLVRPGETVPADGQILDGESAIDEALLTGESMPLQRGPGAALLGGSINVSQPLRMRVTAVGADTVMAEIERSIDRAQADKPRLAELADRVAGRFIGAVLVIVLAVAAWWWLRGEAHWFDIALAVLIVSCPCALSLATPTAISAVLGKLQAAGILVKRGSALEQMAELTHVVFDKTGTLTEGRPRLQRVICRDGYQRDYCLGIAAAIERQSEHPLARALVEAAAKGPAVLATGLCHSAGGGISAIIDGERWCIGSAEYVAAQSGALVPTDWRLDDGDPQTQVLLARGAESIAAFGFADALRADANQLVASLKSGGRKVLLMTGDRLAAARSVAALTGIETVQAGMSPADKMAAVQALQAQGARVIMVGDGINDAPVLAVADLSVAMGGATALARNNADIVLLNARLAAVADIFTLARRTRGIVMQNLSWALAYNFSAIPAAALGLVAPWAAALGMSASSLVVVLNALRLTR